MLLKCSSLVRDIQITQLGGEETKTAHPPFDMSLADLKDLVLSLLWELTRGLRFISLDWTFTSDAEKNSGLCTNKTESHCMLAWRREEKEKLNSCVLIHRGDGGTCEWALVITGQPVGTRHQEWIGAEVQLWGVEAPYPSQGWRSTNPVWPGCQPDSLIYQQLCLSLFRPHWETGFNIGSSSKNPRPGKH